MTVQKKKLDKEEIKEVLALATGGERRISIDKPEVQIVEKKLEAIMLLSDETKNIFSQIKKDDLHSVVRALRFADNPLPSINIRLKELGIEHKIEIPTLRSYVFELFVQSHKIDRKRVEEYLKAIDNLNPRQIQNDIERPRSLLSRLG